MKGFLKALRFVASPIIVAIMTAGALFTRVVWKNKPPSAKDRAGEGRELERFEVGPKRRERPRATVGIPTYNRPVYLEKNLLALYRQTLPPDRFEIVVVNDGGSDEAGATVKRLASQATVRTLYIKRENRGPASARNAALKEAAGEIVAYLDDDCVPDERWLEAITTPFSDDKIAGRGGFVKAAESDSTASGYLDFLGTFERPAKNDDGEIVYPITCNAAFDRRALESVGGFDESFPFPGAEDEDVGIELRSRGYRFEEKPDAMVYHYHKRSLEEIVRVWFRYGYGARLLTSKRGVEKSFYEFAVWKATRVAHVVAKCARGFLAGKIGLKDAATYAMYDFLKESSYLHGVCSASRALEGKARR